MKNPKSGGGLSGQVKSILIGWVVSLVTTAALSALAAACIHAEKLPESAVRPCAWTICALGAVAGCLTAQKLAGRGRLPVSMACGALLLIAMAAGRALSGGSGAAWPCALIVCAAAVGTALVQAGRGKARR